MSRMSDAAITATNPIDNYSETLYSTDVIERIEELNEVRAEYGELPAYLEAELIELTRFAEEASDYAEDWQYGVTLVNDRHFADYARELIEDVYDVTPTAEWSPNNYIDWDRVAEDMQQDYSSVTLTLDGYVATYWVR